MSQRGFRLDMSRCIGCKACQVACKEKNGLPPGVYLRRAEGRETMEGRGVRYSGACNHCARPACAAVCPTGATEKLDDGMVIHRDEGCIGCGRCVAACPYGAPFLDEATGLACKCNACGGEPACVAACPTRALEYGELEELGAGTKTWGAFLPDFLPDPAQTGPALLVGHVPAELRRPHPAGEKNLEKAPAVIQTDTARTYAVLGGGVAAMTAARELRRRDGTAKILLLGAEPVPPYARPMLSKALLRGFRWEHYALANPAWLAEHRMELSLGRPVTALNPAEGTVTLADGEKMAYDKCIYALGAEAAIPPIPGVEQEGVFPLRTLAHLEGIRKTLLTARQAVVVGGGFVGLEAAWHLRAHGLSVTVVEARPRLLEGRLDDGLAGELRALLEEAGIRVVTGGQVKTILGRGRAEGVALEGETLPAQLVVLSTGIRPNTALARAAGLAAERFVEVNRAMETSVPGIYACGDCAGVEGKSWATWQQAVTQAAVAAANAAGGRELWQCGPPPLVLHVGDKAAFSTGQLGGGASRLLRGHWSEGESPFLVNPRKGGETRLTFAFAGNRLTGAALLGSLELSAWLEEEVNRGASLDELRAAARERGIAVYED